MTYEAHVGLRVNADLGQKRLELIGANAQALASPFTSIPLGHFEATSPTPAQALVAWIESKAARASARALAKLRGGS